MDHCALGDSSPTGEGNSMDLLLNSMGGGLSTAMQVDDKPSILMPPRLASRERILKDVLTTEKENTLDCDNMLNACLDNPGFITAFVHDIVKKAVPQQRDAKTTYEFLRTFPDALEDFVDKVCYDTVNGNRRLRLMVLMHRKYAP